VTSSHGVRYETTLEVHKGGLVVNHLECLGSCEDIINQTCSLSMVPLHS
jgi:hypothetical protein